MDEEVWLSDAGEEDFEDQWDRETQTSNDGPLAFDLSLTYQGGQSGGYHVRNRDGERQRVAVSAFQGGPRRKPAFNVTCRAKAMIHGAMGGANGKRASLLVYDLKFLCWRQGTRIKEANILFEFRKASDTSLAPEVIDIRPKGVLKMEETLQNEASKLGLSINIGPDIPGVEAGATVSAERSKAKDRKYHTTVVGDNPPDLDWGQRVQARFRLQENESQTMGIPAELTVAILLERQDDEDFVMVPYIEAIPSFKLTTFISSLASSRTPDDPIYFSVQEPPFNHLGNSIAIDRESLGSADLDSLWDCTMFTSFGTAIKKSQPLEEAKKLQEMRH